MVIDSRSPARFVQLRATPSIFNSNTGHINKHYYLKGKFQMEKTRVLAEFRDKFRVKELLIFETSAWSWSVRPMQSTLGASVISLNRQAANFSEVSAVEMADFANMVVKLESALKKAFGHDRINYLMLMMVDHHVHFHVIPRYADERQFAGLEWKDSGWPSLPAVTESQHRNSVLPLIRDALKAAAESS
ncbi:MAG TPA: HIT family protein [Accumulibacter sp.]|jgi:diadenosine tetraphosphate (Ap4A) HIT family hydrolase|nr:HIT family protein [Accumulibacter sp.]